MEAATTAGGGQAQQVRVVGLSSQPDTPAAAGPCTPAVTGAKQRLDVPLSQASTIKRQLRIQTRADAPQQASEVSNMPWGCPQFCVAAVSQKLLPMPAIIL